MKYVALLLILLAFLPIASAQITQFNETRYADMCFIKEEVLPTGFELYEFIFLSTAYLNESKYFVLGTAPGPYYQDCVAVLRYSSTCFQEDYRFIVCSSLSHPYLTFGNTYFWFGGDDLLIPTLEFNSITLLRFNMTDYIAGGGGQWVYSSDDPLIYPVSISDGNLLSVGPIMSRGYYTDMEATLSFPLIYYSSSDDAKLCYDFYDLDTHQATPENMKCIDYSTGMSDVKKIYVLPTHGHCFRWSDCLFHIIYEGRSQQNNNRYGIYAREVRRGLFGYEFYDLGILPLTNDTAGFQNPQYVGLVDWFYYPGNYPELNTKFYVFLIEPDGRRLIAVLPFEIPSYIIESGNIQIVNVVGSNAFVTNAKNIGSVSSNERIWFNNTKIGNLNNKTYASGNLTVCTYINAGIFHNFDLCFDFYGSRDAGVNSTSCFSFEYYVVGPGCLYAPLGILTIDLPHGHREYNISVYINQSYPPLDIGGTNATLFFDVISEYSRIAVTSSSVVAEAFMVHPIDYYDIGVRDFILQFPLEEVCICSEWRFEGCYNSTHSYMTRTCSPPRCSDEIYIYYNETCLEAYVPPTTTTTISPIPGISPETGYTGGILNLTGTAQELNITGYALVGIAVIDRILSLAGIATLLTIVFTALVGYYTKSGLASGIVAILCVLMFTILGFYPWWLGVVFIIIAGFVIATMLKGVF